MKQTAVEWLKTELESYGDPQYCELKWETLDELVEQAKAMEKEQHNDTWTDSIINISGVEYIGKQKHFEQYYNETYGGNDHIGEANEMV